MGGAKATVMWREGSLFGCQFVHPIPRAAVSAALLRSEPASDGWPQAESGPRLDGPPSVPAHHLELNQRKVPLALRVLKAVGVAALIVGGLAYILITWGVVALSILVAVLAALLALLVRWGFWVIDNTLPL